MAAAQRLNLGSAERWASSFLTWMAFRPVAAYIALAVLCSVLYLPGIVSLPVTDRDEARFAQSSRQMLESGDFVDIRFQDVPRYKKPIGIYWLQAASVSAVHTLGASIDRIWAYRIPSFLSGLGAVLLTFWSAQPIIGRRAALLAAILFASCLTLTFEAHIAKSDAALTLSVVLTQGALFRLYMASRPAATWGLALLFWGGLGAGILLKGPVTPAIVLLTAVFVAGRDKRRAWLQNLHWRWGVPVLLAITLPWFIAIGVSSGGAFFKSSLGQDFAGKIQGGQESHWGPPGLYILLLWWTFWPAALFLNWQSAKWIWQERYNRRALFLLAWIVPFWVLIEAVPTKLPHYALPLYPAIAMAIAMAFTGPCKFGRVPALIWAIIAAGHILALVAIAWLFEEGLALVTIAALALAASATLTVTALRWRYLNIAFMSAMASGIIFYSTAFGFVLPKAAPIWLSAGTQKARQALSSCGKEAPVFAGYSEPSAVFSNGTGTKFADASAAADALAGQSASLAFVNWGRRVEFEQQYRQRAGKPPALLGCIDGLNLNGRGPTRLQIYARPDSLDNVACAPVPETVCRDKADVRWRRLFKTAF